MKKEISFVGLVLLTFLVNSQTALDSLVKPRLTFNYNPEINIKSCKTIFTKKGTLFGCFDKPLNLDFLDESLYHKGILNKYTMMVFRFTDEKSKTIYYLKQWSTPIRIYIDQELPKSIVDKFKGFYAKLKGIPNLNISFTNNFDEANYYIKTTTEEVNSYGKDYEFSSEQLRENSIFTGASYTLYKDKNEKYYAGVLTINISKPKNNEARLKQLKQLFFMSLGQFTISFTVPENSLLHNAYSNLDTIIAHDLDYLKLHYGTIYSQKINGTTFKEIIKLYKTR